jgi:hypothetical protein
MTPYFKSAEFCQCFVFLVWSLFELTVVCLHMASVNRTGLLLGSLLLITGAFYLIKAFLLVVRQRFEKKPDGVRSPIARTFLYSAGTLAVALQTMWYVFRIR